MAVAFALLMGLSWQFGRLSARDPAVPASDGVTDGVGRTVGTGAAPDTLERLVAERDTALAAVTRLEARLGKVQRIAGHDAAELALYRRIESGAGMAGLSVESVELVDAGTPDAALVVTLLQSRGRHRVAGTLGARLLPNAEEAASVRLTPVEFDLRFFQAVRLPLGMAAASLEGAVPPAQGEDRPFRIELDVRPAGDRHPPIIEIRPLDPIVAERSGE